MFETVPVDPTNYEPPKGRVKRGIRGSLYVALYRTRMRVSRVKDLTWLNKTSAYSVLPFNNLSDIRNVSEVQ